MFKNLALSIISIAIILLIVDTGLRIFYPQVVTPRFMINSGFGNRVPAPNKTYKHIFPGDYIVTINTNNTGMRGSNNYTVKKQKEVYRICMLGDSFLFGYGVNDQDVVSSALQKMLTENSQNILYEVLNFGVSGYGQAEELLLYQTKASNYECNEVVVFYFNNDLGNNVVSSLYRVNESGQLIRDKKEYLPGVKVQEILYGTPILGNIVAQSHLWSFVRNNVSAILHKKMLRNKGIKKYEDVTKNSLELTCAIIKKFNKILLNKNILFKLFIIPSPSLESNFPFECLKGLKISLIDGRFHFNKEYYHNIDKHWNVKGHEKAAELLYVSIFNRNL